MQIGGFVAPGFERVAEEFERNFEARGDVGAAFAAVRDGKPIVDLWGGTADLEAGRPWTQDTLQLIFSGTKGLVAACLLVLIDRRLLDPGSPVVHYWPEFGAAGKEDVRVRDLLTHQAGLPGVRTPLTETDLLDGRRLAALLANQPQDADPRAYDAYHPLTFGWLCAELVRRADGRSVGTFFQQEIAEPLNLEIWIGLRSGFENRVSRLRYAPDWGATLPTSIQLAEDDVLSCVWNNPPLFPEDHIPWNAPEIHAAGIPGVGAIGTARSIARFYGCLANGGELEGIRLLRSATVHEATSCWVSRRDSLTGELIAYGLGFEVQTERRVFGKPERAFGYTGAGGSCHGAWPTERLGFSYCMNEMRDTEPVDPRARSLLNALHASL